MKQIIVIIIVALITSACQNKKAEPIDAHTHEISEGHNHDSDGRDEHSHEENTDHGTESHAHNDGTVHEGESHEELIEVETGHNEEINEGHSHENVSLQLTSYNTGFEVFAEATPFLVGKPSSILAHITHLENFKPLEKGSVKASLVINGKGSSQILEKPTRKGIYPFELTPTTAGRGKLVFEIKPEKGISQIFVENIQVYTDEHDALHEAEEKIIENPNGVVFTKEQSWKINFATATVQVESFGQTIRTSAKVQSAPGDNKIVSARSDGFIAFTKTNITEGLEVSAGQLLFAVSGEGLAENNLSVQFIEAKNNYTKTKADFERASELAKDKIVSQKDLLAAQNDFNNAKAVFENLQKNFLPKGQNIKSPFSGFIKQLFVTDGQFVQAGEPLLLVSQNKSLLLKADVQQKYAPILPKIYSAIITIPGSNQKYTLEELNGSIQSIGQHVNSDNYLVPVTLKINNTKNFISGSIIDLVIKTKTNLQALTVPNSALVEELGNYFVYNQLTPELFEKTEVIIGNTDGLRTEIISGLSEKTRVVTEGAVLVKLSQASGALDPHAGHVH